MDDNKLKSQLNTIEASNKENVEKIVTDSLKSEISKERNVTFLQQLVAESRRDMSIYRIDLMSIHMNKYTEIANQLEFMLKHVTNKPVIISDKELGLIRLSFFNKESVAEFREVVLNLTETYSQFYGFLEYRKDNNQKWCKVKKNLVLLP